MGDGIGRQGSDDGGLSVSANAALGSSSSVRARGGASARVGLLLAGVVSLGPGLTGCRPGDGAGALAGVAPDPSSSRAATNAVAGAARFHLGSHTRPVTTSSPEAQRAFDRGLTLAWAFNHGAAEREFRRAAEFDPACAMAFWGVALVNGPHINNSAVSPEQSATAWEAISRAGEAGSAGTPVERALIEALTKRYAAATADDRRALDEAYAAAMREVARAFPGDADVLTLFAEAMMDLRPWDLWTPEGQPQPGTEEVLATLERAMELDPSHPGANHLYIHAIEASPDPAKGLAAADRLRDLVPGAGHLLHMPSHIDVRTGGWRRAAEANERAIEADRAYRASTTEDPGFYSLYMAHNLHFLGFTAMMEGRGEKARRTIETMVAEMPESFVRDSAAFADGFLASPIAVLMRFGRWDEILSAPEPPDYLPIARALRHFARAAAKTALGRLEEAEQERQAFRSAAAAVPEAGFVGNNSAASILAIASKVLDGEMAARRDRFDEAVAALREAAGIEDRLKYDEPPDWIQPVRHTLGAVLLRAGKLPEAEQVYREDLARFPENGWSLFGLGRALRLQGRDDEAAGVEARFQNAWSGADIQLGSTCLCQPPV